MEQAFLVVQREIREYPASQVARQETKDGRIVLVRHLNQDFGNIRRVKVGQGVAENCPFFFVNEFLQVRPKQRSNHAKTPTTQPGHRPPWPLAPGILNASTDESLHRYATRRGRI